MAVAAGTGAVTAARCVQSSFSEWKPGMAASSYRLAVDIDNIVAAVYGGGAAAHELPPALKPANGHSAPADGLDIDQDIIAAARESASVARCTFCEQRLSLLEFPAFDAGERRCHECVALLRCAAQYSMSTTAVRSALHTGAPRPPLRRAIPGWHPPPPRPRAIPARL